MPNVFELDGIRPVIHASAFIHPNATVTGHVTIGRDVYVGPGAAIRGDWGAVEIRDGCNVQENCVIHMFPGVTVILEEAAHVGHGAIIHGAHIGRNALIGMGAVIMDNAVVGENAIVGALSFVPEGMQISDRMLAVGNPARMVREVSDEMLAWKTRGTALYQTLPAQLHAALRPCEPLRDVPPGRPAQPAGYQTWLQSKPGKPGE
jgi:phenylacetic acid degradation protein